MQINKKFFFKELYLENFMSFEQKTFNFAQDISIVVGQNGTGKTSILEAIALSFQLKDRASSVLNYIKQGATKTKIILTATWGGVPLKIESSFSKMGTKGQSKSHRTITYGSDVYEDAQAVNFLISFFDCKALTVSFAMQGNEKFLTTSRTTNLKNLLNLLQLDFSKEIKESKKRLQGVVAERDSITLDLNTKIGAKSALLEVNESSQIELKKVEEKLQEIKIDKEEIQNKENELNNLSEKLVALDLSLGKEDKNKLKEKQQSLENLERTKEDLEKKIQNIKIEEEKETASIEEELIKLKDSIPSLKNSIEDLQKEIKENTSKKAEISTKFQLEKTKQEKLKSGICPLCSQRVDNDVKIDLENKSRELKNSIDEIEKHIETISGLYEDTKKSLEDSEQKLHKKTDELTNIKAIKQKNEYSKNLKESLEKSKENTNESILSLRKEIDELNLRFSEKQSEEKIKEINKLKSSIEELRGQISFLKSQEFMYSDLKSKVDFYSDQINKTKTNLEKTEELIKSFSEKEKSVLKEMEDWTKAISCFNDIPKLHVKKFVKDLQATSTSVVCLFNYDGIEIEIEDDKGIDFYLLQGGLKINYFMCSAFEKVLVNLAIIYALCKFFSVPFVCIDELDSSADFENTRKLGQLVKKISTTTTVVAVSHDTSLVSDLIQSDAQASIIKTDTKF